MPSVDEGKFRELVLLMGASVDVDTLGQTKLWKLLYFIDAAALRETGETITKSEYIKYPHGPVPSRGEKILKRLRKEEKIRTVSESCGGYQLERIDSGAKPDLSVFTPDELKTIRHVLKVYGKQTAAALSGLSHKEPSWIAARRMDKLSPSLMAYGTKEDPDGL